MALDDDDTTLARRQVARAGHPHERDHQSSEPRRPHEASEPLSPAAFMMAGSLMTREEHAKFLAQCKEFVLGMNRLEQSIGKLDDRLTKEEQRTAFKEIFEWLGVTRDVPSNSYTREWARELLAAIGAMVQYDKYEGSADTYIV